MAGITRKTKCYPSDMMDEEWERIALPMPEPGRVDRPREVEFREGSTQCAIWSARAAADACFRFRELARRFLFQTIHDVERMLDREQADREASPTARASAAGAEQRASRFSLVDEA